MLQSDKLVYLIFFLHSWRRCFYIFFIFNTKLLNLLRLLFILISHECKICRLVSRSSKAKQSQHFLARLTYHYIYSAGGIKDFQIHGMVRVVMKPLITEMPMVGGLQIFFLNNPTIDFNLVGVADLLDMPGLSDLLRRIIVEQVATMMVLPNKLPIQLSDAIPATALKTPEPEVFEMRLGSNQFNLINSFFNRRESSASTSSKPSSS